MMYFPIIYVITIIIVAYLHRDKKSGHERSSQVHDKKTGKSTGLTTIDTNLSGTDIRSSQIFNALMKRNFQFDVTSNPEGNIYKFPVDTDHLKIDVKVFERKSDQTLHLAIRNPVLIPALKRKYIYEFIGSFNYFNKLSIFEMSPGEGKVVLKSSLRYRVGNEFTTDNIGEWIIENCKLISKTFPCFNAIAYGNAIPSQIWKNFRDGVDASLN